MEDSSTDRTKMLKERLLESKNQKGGIKTLPFIIANEAFERVASFGLVPDMILYLTGDYGLSLSVGTQIVYFWSASTNFLTVVGAFLSDCYFGRFPMISFGCLASLLGMIVLWLTSMVKEARPPPCKDATQPCESVTAIQLIVLCSSFVLMSVGAGGIKSSSIAFGADQLDKRDNPENASFPLEKFFSWYFMTSVVSIFLAYGGVVYVQENFGWELGFGIPAILMFLSALSFFLASPLYVKLKAEKGLLSGLAKVIVVSFKNRHIELPLDDTPGSYHNKEGSNLTVPSLKLRFLNKACINLNLQQGFTSDETLSHCTVDQVEELKALIKTAPILSTSCMLYVTISQTSILVLLVKSMNRRITRNFEIPAGSMSMFTLFFCATWLALYNHLILPLASKILGKSVSLSVQKRMGIGLLCSFVAMSWLAIAESIRRKTAIQEGFANHPEAIVNISVMWLLPHYVLMGIANAFGVFGQTEFFYGEFPKSMSSISSVFAEVGLTMGNLLASFLFSVVDNITRVGGKESWMSNNINKAHFDYYFGILATLCLINFFYYVLCCKAYGPCVGEVLQVRDDEEKR